jgi:chemotaxis protein CheZ
MPHTDLRVLKRELVGLFGHLQLIRRELAALNPPGTDDHFGTMSDELDAIVNATEGATNTIMESCEGIDGLMGDVRGLTEDPVIHQSLDKVNDYIGAVFEACSFQDITGQRVTKVVNSLKFVEERINAIVVTWGKEELTKVVVEIKEEPDEYKKYLHGPQLPGSSDTIDQAKVDEMLAQDEIDKLFG